jgi:outer membrane autotransporter protein
MQRTLDSPYRQKLVRSDALTATTRGQLDGAARPASPAKSAHEPAGRARRLRRALFGTTALVAVALAGTLLTVPPTTPAFAGGGAGGDGRGSGTGGDGGADIATGQGGNGYAGSDLGGGGGGGAGWFPGGGAGGDGGAQGSTGGGGHGGAPGGTGTSYGVNGGPGGSGSYGAGGGGGGGGLNGYVGGTLPNSDVAGGNGGAGGAGGGGYYSGSGGGGGAGGYGVVFTGSGATIGINVDGGKGGHGGAGGAAGYGTSGGGGGAGGIGLLLTQYASVTVGAYSITGGTGGDGGLGGFAIHGGGGGVGVFAAGAITNNGTINGGHGGQGGDVEISGGTGGIGGHGADGVSLSGGQLINNGTVTGGTGGQGGYGGSGYYGGTGGNGGAGGNGVTLGNGVNLINYRTINGGNGGSGGNGGTGIYSVYGGYNSGAGGNGGNGVNGAYGVSVNNGTVTNYGTIKGGAGGAGGTGGHGDYGDDGAAGAGGYGGTGVSVNGGTVTNSNSGEIYGGTGAGGSRNGNGGIGVTLTNGATLINNGLIRGGYSPGGFAGWGVLAFGNGGTLVNNGAIEGGYSNNMPRGFAIKFEDDGPNRLELWQGSDITGTVDANDGSNDTLALGGTADWNFGASWIGDQYQGFENFEKTGTSTWTLWGGTSATGAWTVDEGTLLVNADLTSSSGLTVNPGGTVGGSGFLPSTTVNGTLGPGGSTWIATLTVDGDVSFAQSSSFAVGVDADAGASDLLYVKNGQANLAGGTVNVVDVDGTFSASQTYTILTADGGVSGTFDQVSTGSTFLVGSLSYPTDNDVQLTLTPESFTSAALTFNHFAVAGALDDGRLTGTVEAAVFGQDTDAAAHEAFDQLSGEAVQASAASALIEDSDFVRDVVMDRIRAAFDGTGTPGMAVLGFGPDEAGGAQIAEGDGGTVPADAATFAAWGTAFGGWGESDGDGNAAGLDRSMAGFLAGGDALVAETWRLGLFAGYSRSSFDADERASSGDSDNFHLGAYGGTQWGALGLRFGGAYTWHDVETSRAVAFDGFADSLTASYDASTAQLFGEAGYRIDTAVASFEPFAGLAYVHFDADGFAEEGGAAALSGEGGSNDVTFTTLGMRASTGFDVGGMQARASGAVGWRHAFGDVTPLATHAFAGSPAFTVAGTPIAEDALVLEAGLDFDVSDSATFGVSYDGQIGDGAQDHAFSGTLKVRF